MQRLYNLSDDQTEFQINDRITFMRFLSLGLSDKVPDAKTIWLFKDTLSKTDAMEKLFSMFYQQLENAGVVTHKGTIIDATFVDAPRQRNKREENKQIKNGDIPVYADSAYVGKPLPEHVENCIHEKGFRGKPLTETQKKNNYQKSKIRCRIEHVFGFMTMSMHGLTVRTIGIQRASFNIGLTNLVYNICRFCMLKKKEVIVG